MRFEKFLLDNYIASDEGQKVYGLFKNIHTTIASGDKKKELIKFINSLLNQPIAGKFFRFTRSPSNRYSSDRGSIFPSLSFEAFEVKIKQTIAKLIRQNQGSARNCLGEIPQESLESFYKSFPHNAFPYLYPVHYNILQNIFIEFDIHLPPLPSARKYDERCYHYIELCRSLCDFRQKHQLSPEELCVFLYGFAPKFIQQNLIKELPQPNKIWIVGASTFDSEDYLPNINDKSIFYWAGRENMSIGDIVFIYEVSPFSRIKYVARTCSEGYDDPFQYYSGKVWLCNPIVIPEIAFDELKKNKHFSKHGLIKAHMQGLSSGRELSHADYDEFKNILLKKKFDISQLPETISYTLKLDVEINDERDVEIHLLEPFLDKLGVQQKHITRQMPLRMGRGIRYYPDYVINATTTRGSEHGLFIWEAKYHILTEKDFTEAFYQAKSYALRLTTKGFGLVSYEGIWIALEQDKYKLDKVIKYKWVDLENKDMFKTVADILKKNFGKLS